jgi:hypothetical protein
MHPLSEWAFAIGNFILNFGTLDLRVFEFLQANLTAEEFAEAKEEPFKTRLNKAAAILSRTPEKTAAVQDLLKRVAPFRELRNHIAHGHLLVKIDDATQTPTITIARTKDQDDSALFGNRPMSARGLLEDSRKVADLSEEFCRLAGLYAGPATEISIPP